MFKNECLFFIYINHHINIHTEQKATIGPTHPFPGVPSPQFFNSGLAQLPKESDVHRKVEAKDGYALKSLKASHPWEASGVSEGKKTQDDGPGQSSPPQGDERLGEEER